MLNKVLLIGNLTRDPEVKFLPSGQAVAKFTVATSRFFKNRDGERQEETTFVDCEAWGKTAEFINQWFQKGKKIFVEGRLRQDSWEDRNTGQKRYKMLTVADNVSFVDSKGGDGDSGGGGQQRRGGGGGGYQQRPPQGGGGQRPPQQRSEPQYDNYDSNAGDPFDGPQDSGTEDDLPF